MHKDYQPKSYLLCRNKPNVQSIKVVFVNVTSVQQVTNPLSPSIQFIRLPTVSAQVREKAECAIVDSHFSRAHFRAAALCIFLEPLEIELLP